MFVEIEILLLFHHMNIKLLIATVALIGFVQNLIGQSLYQPIFKNAVHDFGNIKDVKTELVHDFTLENSGKVPFKIEEVNPSCGCTSIEWSQELIKPGFKGNVTVIFNPIGLSGYFEKTISVTLSGSKIPQILTISGVISSSKDTSLFKKSQGSLKLITSVLNMGKVFVNNPATVKEFEILNGSDRVLSIVEKKFVPSHIQFAFVPNSLNPGQKGVIRLTYNGQLKNMYGFQEDNIQFLTSDPIQPIKSFRIYATLEEFFPPHTLEEKAKFPRLVKEFQVIDFGQIQVNSTHERKFNLTNTGKKVLEIRNIQPNCKCMEVSFPIKTLAAGKSMEVTVRYTSQARKGSQQKYITIYSNDPLNPVQRLSIIGYVE